MKKHIKVPVHIMVALLFITAILLGSCTNKTDKPAPAGGTGETKTSEEAPEITIDESEFEFDEASPGEKAAIGQKAKTGDEEVVINRIEFVPEFDGAQASAGNVLLVVRFSTTNMTKEGPLGLGPVYWKLADNEGNAFTHVQTRSGIFNVGAVEKGQTVSSYIVYDVPEGKKEFTLTYTPFVEGGNNAPAVFELK